MSKNTKPGATGGRQPGDVSKGKQAVQQRNDNTLTAQRLRLLFFLRAHGSVTTLEARRKLDVLHPAGRVLELRRGGVPIETVWVKEATRAGQVHRVERYVLLIKEGAQ